MSWPVVKVPSPLPNRIWREPGLRGKAGEDIEREVLGLGDNHVQVLIVIQIADGNCGALRGSRVNRAGEELATTVAQENSNRAIQGGILVGDLILIELRKGNIEEAIVVEIADAEFQFVGQREHAGWGR